MRVYLELHTFEILHYTPTIVGVSDGQAYSLDLNNQLN